MSLDLTYPSFYPHSDDAAPRYHQRNSSSSSSSSGSSSGLCTPPPASPLFTATRKGDTNVDDDLDFGPTRGGLASPEPGVLVLPPPSHYYKPSAPTRKTLPVAKSRTAISSIAQPSPASSLPSSTPKTQPKRAKPSAVPTRDDEEDSRGRSRWPRLLWSSTVDDDSLEVLRSYHERAVGGPLPLLERGRGQRGVREWSAKLEKAGL
ncbi:hypothetical protein P7C70_g5008, partial [Phenoliferia sp. Uapishka_3]